MLIHLKIFEIANKKQMYDVMIAMIKSNLKYLNRFDSLKIDNIEVQKALSFNFPEYPIHFEFTVNDVHLLRLNTQNPKTRINLVDAILEKNSDLALTLIAIGVDVNAKILYERSVQSRKRRTRFITPVMETTYLKLAIEKNLSDVAIELINAGADVNDNNALYHAIDKKLQKVAIKLIDAKANVKVLNNTLLSLAIDKNLPSIAIRLIKAGADVNDNNPLTNAIDKKLQDVVMKLIDAKPMLTLKLMELLH